MGATSDRERPALTREQGEAVARRSGQLLLSAGAGSGKTSVLVERFVAAVREDDVPASRILAITFTDRAAGELRARIRERLTGLGMRDPAREGSLSFVSTFHSFCVRLLRTHALLAGVDPDFQIIEEGLAARLRERAFSEALGDFLDGSAPRLDLVAAYEPERLQSMLLAAYAELRSRGQRVPRLPGTDASVDEDEQGARAVALLDVLLAGFGERYADAKRERSAADFDDLELGARDLLRDHADVRAQWSQRFDLLMVDEFQDTNRRQLAILSALDRDNLFTVGDELQAIYSFRHAEVELFRGRREALAASGASLRLTSNFRSRPAVIDAVNAAFEDRFGAGRPLLVAAREPARGGRGDPPVELLLTARAGWQDDERLASEVSAGLPSATIWRHAEARALARRVAELVDSGAAKASEVAVLLRSVSDMEVYEGALAQQGISTLATVGSFWERQQIADLLAYLRALANPLDEPALLGVLASPLVGISPDGLALLAGAAAAGRRSLWATLGDHAGEALPAMSQLERSILAGFHERFARERESASRRSIARLIERALDQSSYRELVLELSSGQRRLANIHKLLRLAGRFEASEGRDLRGFLQYVDAREGGSPHRAEPDAPVDELEPDAVRLMSVHAAKGLEFGVVCVADLGRELNLGVGDLLVDGELVGLRLTDLESASRRSALQYELLCEQRRREQAQEEDRILYVAMTRARQRLLLSGAVDVARWPAQRLGAAPISWLVPALAAELPARVRAGESAVFDQPLDIGRGVVRVRVHAAPRQATLPGLELELPDTAIAGVPVRRAAPGPAAGVREENDAERPPAVRLDSLSYTTLSELERCGYRYYLERVLHLPERREGRGSGTGALSARARGTLVHSLLESLDLARPQVDGEAVVRAARALGMSVDAREREEIAALVGALWGTGGAGAPAPGSPGTRVAAALRVHREYPFAFSLGAQEPLLSGVIDLLAHERDGAALVLDYKTDRVSDGEDLAALVARDYGAQRLLYALAVLRAGAARVEIVHWFLHRPEDWAGASYERAQLPELESELRARIAAAQRFVVSAHPRRSLCETCPGRGTLCSYDEAVALAE